MKKIFRAPVTTFQFLGEETIEAIESLLSLADGRSCFRVDLYMNSTSFFFSAITSNVSYFTLGEDQKAKSVSFTEMSEDIRTAFLKALGHVNDDSNFLADLENYPLPWLVDDFSDSVTGRYMSILFLGNGIGAVIQEDISGFVDLAGNTTYFSETAPAKYRAEILSVFLEKTPSNHKRLSLEADINKYHPMLSAMFQNHCYGNDFVELGPLDPSDTF